MKKIKFDKNILFDKALDFDSIEQFKAEHEGLYLWSLREKHFQELKYTFKARDFTSRFDWFENDLDSFNEAKKENVLNEVSKLFNESDIIIDEEFARNEISTYEYKKDFRKYSKRVYDWLKKEKTVKEFESNLK